jgi:hypothetical protein
MEALQIYVEPRVVAAASSASRIVAIVLRGACRAASLRRFRLSLPAFARDVEVDRLLNRLTHLALLGHGDRDPGLTRPAAVLDHPGRPVLSDLVVQVGLRVGRVEDWVIYGCCLAAVTAGFNHRRSVTLDPTDEHPAARP